MLKNPRELLLKLLHVGDQNAGRVSDGGILPITVELYVTRSGFAIILRTPSRTFTAEIQ